VSGTAPQVVRTETDSLQFTAVAAAKGNPNMTTPSEDLEARCLGETAEVSE